jgi:hypothetical protein
LSNNLELLLPHSPSRRKKRIPNGDVWKRATVLFNSESVAPVVDGSLTKSHNLAEQTAKATPHPFTHNLSV